MTKPRREELRDLYKIATEPYTDDDTLDDVLVKHRQRGEAYGLLAGKLVAALPELLDSDERLEAARDAGYSVYVKGMGPSIYEQGIRDAAGTILNKIEPTGFPSAEAKAAAKEEA